MKRGFITELLYYAALFFIGLYFLQKIDNIVSTKIQVDKRH